MRKRSPLAYAAGVPPKAFLGHKWGVIDYWNKMIPEEYTYHQNTFCGALSVKPRSMVSSVQRPKELKKVRNLANSPLSPPYHRQHGSADLL